MIYFIGNKEEGPIKIGYTSKNKTRQRLHTIQTGCFMDLSVLYETDELEERDLHSYFNGVKIRGEWFQRKPVADFLKLFGVTVSVNKTKEKRSVYTPVTRGDMLIKSSTNENPKDYRVRVLSQQGCYLDDSNRAIVSKKIAEYCCFAGGYLGEGVEIQSHEGIKNCYDIKVSSRVHGAKDLCASFMAMNGFGIVESLEVA